MRAPQFVITAGAIESTRLLLLADRTADDQIFAPHDILGRYFHDHIADTVGYFTEKVPRALNRVSGFRFEQGGMRNLRFEPSATLRKKGDLPAAFAHITFTSDGQSPFDGLRQVLRAIQRREMPARNTLFLLLGSSSWMARAAWWRFARKRLLYPDNIRLKIDLVMEQEPVRNNRIDLSDKVDQFGSPLARIDWHVTPQDQANMLKLTKLLLQGWLTSPLAKVADLELVDEAQREANLLSGGGVYHPGGSTRLGLSASKGVVDRDLRTFGIPNVTVVATSIFPTGGGANPTMMLILAALRAADRLIANSST